MDNSTKCKGNNFILVNRMWLVQIWNYIAGMVEYTSSHQIEMIRSLITVQTFREGPRARCWVGTWDTVHGTKGCDDVISLGGRRT